MISQNELCVISETIRKFNTKLMEKYPELEVFTVVFGKKSDKARKMAIGNLITRRELSKRLLKGS